MRIHRLLALAATVMALEGSASAQLPRHALNSIFPAGGQAGMTVAVEIGGAELEGPVGLAFDHPGLRGFRLKGPKFVVAIAPDVPPGHHDVRLSGPLGISNPRAFVVGDRPERREVEPNNTPETAQTIAIGDLVNGRLDASPDVDSFAFAGRRGRSLVVEIATTAIDTKLDAVFHLLSPSGRELIGPSDTPGPEPSLAMRLPEDGRYVLQVHDLVYAGSADHGYRLTLRDGPRIEAIRPVAAGQTSSALVGRNLGASSAKADGGEWESRIAPILPMAGGSFPSVLALTRGRWARMGGPSGPSNPALLRQTSDLAVPEIEPDDDTGHAMTIGPPAEISASFRGPGDVDHYRFHASQGQTWVVDILADRIGTPADPEFLVRKIVKAGAAPDLLTGDDLADPFAGRRFPAGSLDARSVFKVPEDGDYEIVVRDSFGSSRSDKSLVYSLIVRPERPDFDLILVPNDGTNPEGTTLRAGGRVAAYVLAHRIDGLTGPIRVEARDLPIGVTCEPVVIGPNQVMAPIVFTAGANAARGLGSARLVGRNLSGDRKEVLDHATGRKVVPEIERDALYGALVWPMAAGGGDSPAIAQARTSSEFAIAVIDGAPFRLSAKPESAVVGAGETLEWTVEVERRPGFTEAVQVTASDLPPNLPAPAAVSIAKDKTSATVKVTIPKNVPPGPYTMAFHGSGPFPFRKDPAAKDAANVTVNEPSNTVTVTIRP